MIAPMLTWPQVWTGLLLLFPVLLALKLLFEGVKLWLRAAHDWLFGIGREIDPERAERRSRDYTNLLRVAQKNGEPENATRALAWLTRLQEKGVKVRG